MFTRRRRWEIRRSRPRAWALAALWLFVACGGDPQEAPEPERDASTVTTTPPVPEQVVAGQSVVFPCDDASLSVLPEGGGFAPLLGRHVALVAGTWRWRCVGGPEEGRVEVLPAALEQVSWEALPRVVRQGRSLEVEAWPSDRFGNRGREALEVRFSPEDAVEAEGDRWRFHTGGLVRVEALRGAEVVSERTIFVDTGPPVVTVTSPLRGSIIDAEREEAVRVEGRVEEDGPELELFINDALVPVKDGRFAITLTPPRAGMHVIRYRARDSAGHDVAGSRAFLYGSLRAPFAGCARAVRLFLPEVLLDDEAPDVDDLSRIAELLLARVQLPGGRVDLGCRGWVEIRGVTWTPLDVDLRPGPDTLELSVSLRDIEVAIGGEACMCGFDAPVACYETSGKVLSTSAQARLLLGIGEPGKPTALSAREVELELAPLTFELEALWGGLNWAVELYEDDIRASITSDVKDALSAQLTADLSDFFKWAIPTVSVRLPEPVDEPLEMDLDLSMLLSTSRGLLLELDATVLRGAPRASAPSGLLTVKACSLPPPLPRGKVGVAFSLDLLNDAFFTLYHRGALSEVELTLPDGRRVRVSASLPPVLMPADNPGQVRLSVGDAKVSFSSLIGRMQLYASVELNATLSYDVERGEVVLTFLEEGLSVLFEAASPEDARIFASSIQDLEAFMRDLVIERVVSRQIRVALPLLDLSRYSGVPELAGRRLTLEDAQLSVTRSGYISASGRIAPR